MNKNWAANCPPYDSQYSGINHTDVQDCTTESLCHGVFFVTSWWTSPEDLAISADLTNINNRNVEHVLQVANNVGFTPFCNCPTPASFTMDSYYGVDNSRLSHQTLDIQLVAPNLNVSPIWTELAWGLNLEVPTRHMVMMIDDQGNYFDSEPGKPIKNIKDSSLMGAAPATIVWQSSFKINKQPIMSNVEFVQNGNSGEYGFFVPATTPTALVDKALNFGLNIQNEDGTVNFPSAKQVSGL